MTKAKNKAELHILYVLENYYPNVGGVESLFKKLIESMAAQGHRVTLITTRLSKEHPAKEIDGKLRIFRYRFYNRYLFTLLAFFPILKHVGACELVHTTSYNAALPAFLGAVLRRKKIVVSFHEVWASLWFRLPYMSAVGKYLHFLFEKILLRLPFDRFVGVSQSTSNALIAAGVRPQRVRTIYNGIDYEDFSDGSSGEQATNPQAPFTYTYFGRLGVSKGLDILLEAATEFKKRYPYSRLKMIIPKTPRSFFNLIFLKIKKEGMEDYVQMLHDLPFETLKKELRRSDCVVIPSLNEGFCFAAVESIALGVPLISSDRGALREVVSGKFIKMESPDSLSLVNALIEARAGNWELSPIKKFELKETVSAYLALYQEVMSGSAV